MLNVGLTGGIASGKSTVAQMLVELGAVHIDFDVLAHRVERPGQPAWEELVAAFGREILNGDETINRAVLGEVVFRDAARRERLNAIVHPAVFASWRRELEDIEKQSPHAVVLSDVPLLFEVGAEGMVDLVLLVYIPPAEQLRRLMLRNGYTRPEAEARLASQMSIDAKLARADLVIDNRGTREETRRRAAAVWEELRERELRRRKT
ncbi:MAG TPA: dephospho-CoA kinase [Syntrophales bacterium]|jgi:dephospho-CoA kinase|nr:dephospho-CoA kinase [Syntrophales bacterium]HOU78382.1 dephospho-CoA kinase [Syntrophales bacterium]HPC32739.1 dephospho-CoA kinase [Syntrophales bacterium]HQI36845.1 dephospho-CoA kinase [Syntrophales bacterium]HRR48166.1 dephospho-CoA kinase [Syntrophales bacterium]